jgi:hypothetical protein
MEGQIPQMDKVLTTALAVKNLDYPVGWLWQKHYWNHNNMDVVTLFKYGCLQESLQPDGSFMPTIADGSVEEAEAYGVDFLDRIGYFNKTKRFWTTEDFPDSGIVREKILAFVHQHSSQGGAGGNDYDDILKELSQ